MRIKRLIPAIAAIAALAIPSAAMANASTAQQVGGTGVSAGVYEAGWTGSTQGGGTKTTQFSATYTDPVFGGPIICNGVNQVKKGSTTQQDSFTCSLTNNGAWANVPQVGQTTPWNSDFYGVQNKSVTTGSMTVTAVQTDANGNVTGYTGVATY
jgi:hypothetical protein